MFSSYFNVALTSTVTDPNVEIHELDIPVNAVATALKDFVSKRLPSLFEEDVMLELEDIAGIVVSTRYMYPIHLRVSLLSAVGTRLKPMAIQTGNIEVKTDRSCRLLALRSMLDKLPPINFQVLKFIFQHFVKYVSFHSMLALIGPRSYYLIDVFFLYI